MPSLIETATCLPVAFSISPCISRASALSPCNNPPRNQFRYVFHVYFGQHRFTCGAGGNVDVSSGIPQLIQSHRGDGIPEAVVSNLRPVCPTAAMGMLLRVNRLFQIEAQPCDDVSGYGEHCQVIRQDAGVMESDDPVLFLRTQPSLLEEAIYELHGMRDLYIQLRPALSVYFRHHLHTGRTVDNNSAHLPSLNFGFHFQRGFPEPFHVSRIVQRSAATNITPSKPPYGT